jgi:hypothetical protein
MGLTGAIRSYSLFYITLNCAKNHTINLIVQIMIEPIAAYDLLIFDY